MRSLLLLLFGCLPLFLFGQGIKLLNAESVLMSSAESTLEMPGGDIYIDFETLTSSTEILKIDTLTSPFYFNAIDWQYNSNNELWLKIQCLKPAQQCCECSPEKIGEGWIAQENTFAPSLFSDILLPFSKSMIERSEVVMVNDFQNYEVQFLGEGWYIEGYGGVLFVNGRVNIGGELVELIYKSEASYPSNLGALNFDPYYTYQYQNIEFKIFLNREENRHGYGVKFIEITREGVMQRILITKNASSFAFN